MNRAEIHQRYARAIDSPSKGKHYTVPHFSFGYYFDPEFKRTVLVKSEEGLLTPIEMEYKTGEGFDRVQLARAFRLRTGLDVPPANWQPFANLSCDKLPGHRVESEYEIRCHVAVGPIDQMKVLLAGAKVLQVSRILAGEVKGIALDLRWTMMLAQSIASGEEEALFYELNATAIRAECRPAIVVREEE